MIPENPHIAPHASFSGTVASASPTYLPKLAGSVLWQANVANGHIESISFTHNRTIAQLDVRGNHMNRLSYTDHGRTFNIAFSPEGAKVTQKGPDGKFVDVDPSKVAPVLRIAQTLVDSLTFKTAIGGKIGHENAQTACNECSEKITQTMGGLGLHAAPDPTGGGRLSHHYRGALDAGIPPTPKPSSGKEPDANLAAAQTINPSPIAKTFRPGAFV